MMSAQTTTDGMYLSELFPEHKTSSGSEALDPMIKGITIDSRAIKAQYLFAAVEGIHTHGKNYVKQAIENGAAAILIDEKVSLNVSVPVVSLQGMEKKLSRIAGQFYGDPSRGIPFIGITGTNGKTTCSQLIAQAFALLGISCGVMGTLGFGVLKKNYQGSGKNLTETLSQTGMTTPDPVSTQQYCSQLIDHDAEVVVMEVSSHGLVQHRVEAIDIDTAVFTNLSHDHLDYHGSMKAYGAAKAMLFNMASVSSAVINADDAFSQKLIDTLRSGCKLFTYSLYSETHLQDHQNHFYVKSLKANNQGIDAVVKTPEGEFGFHTALIGEFNISNLLAVIATLYARQFSLNTIIPALSLLKPIAGRMELVPSKCNIQVVIDFSHTPDALQNALNALRNHTHNKLWCVFGCGGDRDREKRPKMAAIAEALADKVVVTSDNPRAESVEQIFNDVTAGFTLSHEVIADRAAAIKYAIEHAGSGDMILIAGKGHESYQIIGEQKHPFSDHKEAHLSLRSREERALI